MDHYALLCLPVYKFVRTHLNTHEYMTDGECVCARALCALTVSIRAFTFHFHAFFRFAFSFLGSSNGLLLIYLILLDVLQFTLNKQAAEAVASPKTHSMCIAYERYEKLSLLPVFYCEHT